MPIYEFQCDRCGHVFDRLQKLSDPDPDICPDCGEPAIRRRLTAPAFRLSGSGWYETDFKKDGDKKRNLTEKGDSPSVGAMPESKGDATPSSKSEPRPSASSDAAAPAKPAPKPDPKPASTPVSRPASE
jgi:putative FmdB family regulatory protein